jgi:hypothetical protein
MSGAVHAGTHPFPFYFLWAFSLLGEEEDKCRVVQDQDDQYELLKPSDGGF